MTDRAPHHHLNKMSDLWPSLHKRAPDPQPEEDWFNAVEGPEGDTQGCPVCQTDDAVATVGSDVVCKRCGTIIDTPLDQGAEYRWFSADAAAGGADPSRCGFPVNPLMPESSLGTMIMSKQSASPLMRRIKRYHMWNLMPYRERSLWGVFDGLQTRAMNAGLNTAVIEEAKQLYAQLTTTTVCRGQQQRDAMLAACLWESLKRHDTPRMPRDLAEIFNIELRHVTRGIKTFQHLIAKQAAGPPNEDAAADEVESAAVIAARASQRKATWQRTVGRTTTYEDFIQPFIANLSLPNAGPLEALVRRTCERIEELGIVPENTPPSLTASVIAFCASASGLSIDQTDIARVCSVSPVTITKCLKRIQPWKEKLLAQ